MEATRRIQEYIRAGDCYQVVPSRRVARPTRAHPFAVYRALRSINPSPYMFYLALDDFAVAGASPELLVQVEAGEIAVHPIAGTRRRDADPAVDAALEAELRADEKERAEHLMLVDLGRNDVGRVSAPGSVRVTQFMEVERYSHVMHLVSHVTGQLRADLTPYDALRAGFPAGTVSGAPKTRAMQIIAEVEGQRRGVYAGAVGYIGFDGSMDTCIAIRSLTLKDGVAYAQAGGGIVADSEPEAEYRETENKLGATLRALEEAEITMLLLIDNYDSFTYNLYQYLAELGAEPLVRRNDEITVAEAQALRPTHLVLSPGPCTPREAGVCVALIQTLGPRIPTLGVCLGHQCIGVAFGGVVVRAPEPVHGKVSQINHRGDGVFRGLPIAFRGDALPQPDRRARDVAGRPGGDGGDRRWPGDGAAPPRLSHRGRAVSSRVHPDARGQAAAGELPGG